MQVHYAINFVNCQVETKGEPLRTILKRDNDQKGKQFLIDNVFIKWFIKVQRMHEKGTNSMPVIEYTLRLYIALSLCITMNVCVCVCVCITNAG